MNEAETRILLAKVDVFWPGQLKLPDEDDGLKVLVATWANHLSDVTLEAAEAALESIATEGGRFPPPLGVLRAHAVRLSNGDRIPDPDEAWGEVLGQVSATGYYGIPTFTHPAIKAAVAAMGWRNICTSEAQVADRAHFLKIYGTVSARAEREALMPASVRELLKDASAIIGHPGELTEGKP